MAETCDLAVIGLGALGSSTAWHAASRGLRVVGLEAFEFGHDRGASHDTSRIIRHSYHTPAYVALTFGAYDEWSRLEDETGEQFVTVTGGLDLFPPDAQIPMVDYTSSMDAHDIAYDVLDVGAVGDRWPAFVLPDGTTAIHQARTGIVPAAKGTAAMAGRARDLGATLHYNTRVEAIVPGIDGVDLVTTDGVISAGRVVVTADAWTAGLLAPLGVDLPLTVTEEQVTYFAPARPAEFRPDVFPVWIWMDEPSYYGFPTYGEETIKAAQDCGGPTVTGDDRSGVPDDDDARTTFEVHVPGRARLRPAHPVQALSVHLDTGPRLRRRSTSRASERHPRSRRGPRVQVRGPVRTPPHRHGHRGRKPL